MQLKKCMQCGSVFKNFVKVNICPKCAIVFGSCSVTGKPMPELMPESLVDSRKEIVKLIIEGLITNTLRHKQLVLEKIFRTLCTDDYVDEAKNEFQWKEGAE